MKSFSERPEGARGEADYRLRSVNKRLVKAITDTQRLFTSDIPVFHTKGVAVLAEILTEFGEDLHNQIGLWDAYEAHNLQCFGNPLPITLDSNQVQHLQKNINIQRTHHFLWCLYPQLVPGTIIAPDHPDLLCLARIVTETLKQCFQKIPKSSGVKEFLDQPNDYGWDVKKKLVWLGSRSYMFRTLYANYVSENNPDNKHDDVDITDDFICQSCTAFSGLGAVDVLASVLDISESDKSDLRQWYERYVAPYAVLYVDDEVVQVKNVITDVEYQIRMNLKKNPFKAGSLVVGGIVPWRGEWYWSGRQRAYGDANKDSIDDMKEQFLRTCPQIVSRYHKEYAQESARRCQIHYERLVAQHGKNLVLLPDGLSLAAFLEAGNRQPFRQLPDEEQESLCIKYNLPKDGPRLDIPDNLLRSEHEIGVFFSPEEYIEIMDHFDTLVQGLQNPARPLPKDEAEIIYGFIESLTISPAFVRHVVELYGEDAIKSIYFLADCNEPYCLDYLLRRYKGMYFKKRYSPVANL